MGIQIHYGEAIDWSTTVFQFVLSLSVAWLASLRASAEKNPGFAGESRCQPVFHDESRLIQVQKTIKQILFWPSGLTAH